MTLKSKHIVAIVLAVFIIGIGGTMIFNLWQTTSSKVPATYTTGDLAGRYNPADLRGSYSFGDIQEAFGVPVSALAEAFGVRDSGNPADFLCKSLEDLYAGLEDGEIGTDSVRWFVALYSALPYTPEEDTLLPSPALSVLQQRLSEAELVIVREKIVNQAGSAAEPEVAATEAAVPAEQADTHTESDDGQIRGKTTFGELLSWGVSKATIERVLGLPIGKSGIAVRDYCIDNGIEFSTVKDALQEAADRARAKQ